MRHILALIALVAGLTAGCASGSAQEGPSIWDRPQVSWDSPEVYERYQRDAVHPGFAAFALSPDGRYMAIPPSNGPSNELIILDWRARTGVRVTYPTPNFSLQSPAFSPDGQHIALAAMVVPRGGLGEIWVLDLQGRLVDRIGECGNVYDQPTYSPDGRHMAYLRDLYVPGEYSRHRLEYRGDGPFAPPWGFFERDLSTGQERRIVDDTAWAHVDWFGYAPDGESFFAVAADMMSFITGDDILERYVPGIPSRYSTENYQSLLYNNHFHMEINGIRQSNSTVRPIVYPGDRDDMFPSSPLLVTSNGLVMSEIPGAPPRFRPTYGEQQLERPLELSTIILTARGSREIIRNSFFKPGFELAENECVLAFYDNEDRARRTLLVQDVCGSATSDAVIEIGLDTINLSHVQTSWRFGDECEFAPVVPG